MTRGAVFAAALAGVLATGGLGMTAAFAQGSGSGGGTGMGPGGGGPAMGPGGGKPGAMFQKCDTNNDGKLSKEEFMACRNQRAAAHFDKIDANHDGYVTKEEMQKAHAEMQKHRGPGGGPGGPGMQPPGNKPASPPDEE